MWFPRFLLINLGKAHFFLRYKLLSRYMCLYKWTPRALLLGWGETLSHNSFLHLLTLAHASIKSPFIKISSVKHFDCFIRYYVTPPRCRILRRVFDCPGLGQLPVSPHPRREGLCSHSCVKGVLPLTESHSHGNFSKNRKDVTMISNFKKDKCLPDCENDK